MKRYFLLIILAGLIGWTLFDTLDFGSNKIDTIPFTANQTQDEYLSKTVGLNQGDLAPDFEITTLQDETVKLSDYRGQKVMLNFWATWCPPCRAEMPDMQKLYEKNDITILAVNLTDTEKNGVQDVETFIDEFGLTFPILLDQTTEIAHLYQIQPIPTSYFITTTGHIESVSYGALHKEMIIQRFQDMN